MLLHFFHGMKREDQQNATIRCLLSTCVSTCFGHHYTHLQENKDRVTAYDLLLWFCRMWLVAVEGRCVVGCEHMLLHTRHPIQYRPIVLPAVSLARLAAGSSICLTKT